MKPCGTCRWFAGPTSQHIEYGECHGAPPQVTSDKYDESYKEWVPRFYWPRVFASSVGCRLHEEESHEPVSIADLPEPKVEDFDL